MSDEADTYFAKAQESLAGAESEFANARYNNCANRCYYACFQGAVSALIRAGIRPRGNPPQWGHSYVQAYRRNSPGNSSDGESCTLHH